MALAERDSRMNATAPSTLESIRGHADLPVWASALVIAGIVAILVVGIAFLARRLGMRPKLSWFFALGVGLWLAAPFAADNAAGGLMAAAGLFLLPGAVVAELLLRRREQRLRGAG